MARLVGGDRFLEFAIFGATEDAKRIEPRKLLFSFGRLDSLCVLGCTEYRELKKAIATYKASHKPTN